MNGDRRSDVVVGSAIGATYVVFGKTTNDPVVLARLARKGFGIADNDFGTAGSAVAGAGDVNADGRSDLIVSNAELEVGFNAYVVFGKGSRAVVRLHSLKRSRRGFAIVTSKTDTGADHDVASAGDVNGDGLADVIVSAVLVGRHGKTRSVSSYVVFGRRSARPVKLDRLGRAGTRLAGVTVPLSKDLPSPRVAGVGDVVGDGRPDIAVSDYLADGDGRQDSGSTYVVSGSSLVARAR